MRLSRIILLLAAGTIGALAASGPAIASDPATPQVGMTMTDRVTGPNVGQVLRYTVTLVNKGRTPLSTQIRLTAPNDLTGLGAVSGSVVDDQLSWSARIAPAATLTVGFTGTVTGASTRLTATACAYVDANGQPIACASDVDQVVRPAVGHHALALIIGGMIALALASLAVAAAVAWQRHRRSLAEAPGTGGLPGAVSEATAAGSTMEDDLPDSSLFGNGLFGNGLFEDPRFENRRFESGSQTSGLLDDRLSEDALSEDELLMGELVEDALRETTVSLAIVLPSEAGPAYIAVPVDIPGRLDMAGPAEIAVPVARTGRHRHRAVTHDLGNRSS